MAAGDVPVAESESVPRDSVGDDCAPVPSVVVVPVGVDTASVAVLLKAVSVSSLDTAAELSSVSVGVVVGVPWVSPSAYRLSRRSQPLRPSSP